ncbi:MAG: hypothetical protein ABI602_01955 [Candidatus Saccharibacteria bacterium]
MSLRTNNLPLPPRNRRTGRTSFLLATLAIVLVAVFNLQAITDWLALRNYQPPAALAALAEQTTMTPEARRVFYVNHPELNSKAAFGNFCPSDQREKTIILGCYHGNQHGIFLLDVSDPRLSGVEDVTAAHEMLHAEYDRLSSRERGRVDAMLQAYFDNDLHDQRIIDTIAAYRTSEPKDVVNEMHSVFGSEVATLPSDLAQYYQRYFTNRAAVVAYAATYQDEFTSRQTAVAQDDRQLTALKIQITNGQDGLKARQATITSTQKTLLAARDRGDSTLYNAGVPGYNAMINDYNSQVEAVRTAIESYNALVTSRNAIALEEAALASELSSSVTPISH